MTPQSNPGCAYLLTVRAEELLGRELRLVGPAVAEEANARQALFAANCAAKQAVMIINILMLRLSRQLTIMIRHIGKWSRSQVFKESSVQGVKCSSGQVVKESRSQGVKGSRGQGVKAPLPPHTHTPKKMLGLLKIIQIIYQIGVL